MSKKLIVTSVFLIVLVAMVPLGIFIASQPQPESKLIISIPTLNQGAAGRIIDLTIKQYDGDNWITRGTAEDDGFSITLQPDQQTNFTLKVGIYTIYASSTEQALNYTRVYIDISDEIVNTLMTGKSALGPVGEDYWVYHSYLWADGPTAGETYTVTFDYQAYY